MCLLRWGFVYFQIMCWIYKITLIPKNKSLGKAKLMNSLSSIESFIGTLFAKSLPEDVLSEIIKNYTSDNTTVTLRDLLHMSERQLTDWTNRLGVKSKGRKEDIKFILEKERTTYAETVMTQYKSFDFHLGKALKDSSYDIRGEMFQEMNKHTIDSISSKKKKASATLAFKYFALIPQEAREYLGYLKRYSYVNKHYIISQMFSRDHSPCEINTFAGWSALGYKIKKGEKGMGIIFPYTRTYKNSKGEDDVRVNYRWKNCLFCREQVVPKEGEEVLEIDKPEETTLKEEYDNLKKENISPFEALQRACIMKGLDFPAKEEQ